MAIDYVLKTPENILELVKLAEDKSNWKNRFKAAKELKLWKCKQSIAVLTKLALHDPVFTVKEEAFKGAQAFGIIINGKPIFLEKKPKGNLVKDINYKIQVVRNKLPVDCDIKEFKQEFARLYPEPYDTYKGDKQDKFDQWLENMFLSVKKTN